MSRRRRGKIRRFRFFAGLTALAILLVLGLLTAVGYYTAGEKELFVRTDGYLQAGAGPQAEMTAQIWAEKIRAAEEQAAEQEEQAEERLPEVDPSLRLPNTVDFAALWEQNEDVYAWITVPGTLVDYPVLQHPSDDEYYLHHTIDHVEGLPGSIYSETVNAKDFTDMNTILYGHNMKNDTMFGSLHE